MFLKLILITIATHCCAETYQETSLESVEKALQELNDLSTQIEGSMLLIMNDQANILRDQLNEMVAQTKQEINDQISNITSKITIMSEKVQTTTGTNVNIFLSSSKNDLEAFASELNNRLLECQGEMIMTGNDLLYTVWNRVLYQYDIGYECRKMLLVQCRDYESGRCPDAVSSSIRVAKDSLSKTFEKLNMEMTNQIVGMIFPCRQMIVQELALYPSLILEFVRTCLDDIVTSSYTVSC